MVNCNPETVSTDYDMCDRLYFDELSFEVGTRPSHHDTLYQLPFPPRVCPFSRYPPSTYFTTTFHAGVMNCLVNLFHSRL